MANYMEATLLQEFLMHILSPIYRITEDDTIRDQQMGEYT
jgi:U3 small nucleolar RNA-associated protein 20